MNNHEDDGVAEEIDAVEPTGIAAGLAPSAGNHRVAQDLRGRTMTHEDFTSLSRRSLLTGAAGALAGFVGWRWIQGRPEADNIPDILRSGHELNETIWRGLFREGAEAPTFDFSESSMMRFNGRHGLESDLNLDTWELRVVGTNGEQIGSYGVDDLRSFDQVEMTVEHKCVEGWSHIITWGGLRFSDFVERFHPDQADAPFVGLYTPDDEYRVGLEREAMMHSQTMLTLDMQRAPLEERHGAPVRLTTPLKYGIKQIKRIGTIEFSETQPTGDYWATRGYDWYAAL